MLKDKTYLVTGGSRGIGRAAVMALWQAGANVAFTYRNNHDAAEELCAQAQGAENKLLAIQANAEELDKAKETVAQVKQAFGTLDGIVINAGITRDKPLFMMDETEWDDIMNTNLKGTYNYAKAVVYDFMKQRSGRIICVSSISGLMGVAGQTNYSAAKSAQIGFVRSLSKEISKFGITVNAVAPGFIETDMWRDMDEKERDRAVKQIPAGRIGSAEEVSHAICFLMSPQSSYITGNVLVVDGGLSS
ncbi:SDR family oxidoreductase [Paenibacillus sp. 5J-6]|uniref:SDR family oxidoreductase n=1 Tax=Paenibacillus silvestris TaxID=2606219 RepID=A0A6L8URE1_9BACL|nr:3-oxoacyl-ACP reductase FabG [Paenibacillus silvestris]MZQ80573.1 SDR family oxidoreductase [Paenibacillus silvestris]